ncbi:RNA 2',3'-cyclic phosphodiesterase [Sphingomonas parva]|uniref:RNA 2',3'-cyclic phosphodiesterase n=1 Tax=Sphingomonas parva TaxID=2555898 RepID=A0A4Y8ZN40_9SPHN|nr:RNA 2',3'-cyclic phosphodiesterase [Sphingomonas parva]TFI57374.1 RNA 2',3'-cyclic phosphodiesterase [Sphingomonas parva]
MIRLFVAIRPPAAIRERLLGLMGGVRGARWQTDDQLHLTLRFIGDVDRHQAEDVDAALSSLHHPRFDLALDGIGAFDRRGAPTVLWAGVSPIAPLKSLHKKIDQALVRAGLEPERRAYAAHITLARIARGGGPVEPFLVGAGSVSSPPFPVDEFVLCQSHLTPAGAVYETVARYALG